MKTKIDFTSVDGTLLTGLLQVPSNQHHKMNGAFLLMHGLPSDKEEWGFYTDMADELERNNYASFRFDFRYNGFSQKGDYKNLTLSEMVNDIDAAFNILIQSIDNECKLYIVGTSCGGGVSLMWANTLKRNISGMFLMAPVLDYVYESCGEERKRISTNQMFLPKTIQSELQKSGFINRDIAYGIQFINEAMLFDGAEELSRAAYKIFIYQGTIDSVVPIKINRAIINSSSSKNIIFTEIPDANHGFAVEGDDNLTAFETKENHRKIYKMMLESVRDIA